MARPVAIETARIFIQIPSYRDRECQWTIRDAFAKATCPERIAVGVCWQFDPEADQDCFVAPMPAQDIRRVDFLASQAQGLGWARLQAQNLWCGEEFTLQIDSHMRFAPGWDVLALRELEACPSPWPVLTLYPAAYWPPDQLEETANPLRAVQAIKGFTAAGILQFTVAWAPEQAPIERPKPTAAVAGGFIFGPSRIIADVPSDPHIYFEGEEPNLAVRLWTHGFDLFSPRVTILYHYYRRSDSRRPWDDANPAAPNARSLHRMRQLTEPAPGDAAALASYGLGTARSLAEYELFAGVDFHARSLASYAMHYPFVYTDEMASALVRAGGLQPAEGATLFLLGDQGLLFSPARRGFFRLTPNATFCWCCLEEGMAAEDIVAALASRAGLSSDSAREQVQAQFCHWQGSGLLGGGVALGDPAPPASDQAIHWPILPPPGPPAMDSVRLLAGVRLRLRCFDAHDAALVAPMVSHLPTVPDDLPGDAESVIEVLAIGSYRYVVRDSLYPPCMVVHPVYLASAVAAALEAAAAADPSALLHVAGTLVGDPGAVTLLLGDPDLLVPIAAVLDAAPYAGEGGSAGRISAACPNLLARMRVRIGRANGALRPVPAPMLVPQSIYESWCDRLGLPPDLPVHHGFASGPLVIPAFDRPGRQEACHAGRIVIVSRVPNRPARLLPISAAEALAALIGVSDKLPALATAAEAAALIDWLEVLPCSRMLATDHADALAVLMAHDGSPPIDAT